MRLTIIYSNNRSPDLRAYELQDFKKNGFEVIELTSKEFLAREPDADVVWPYFRSIPPQDEDVLLHIDGNSKYRNVLIINDYRKFKISPSDKWASYNFVKEQQIGINIPQTFKLGDFSEIKSIVSKMYFPLVLKAYPSGQGKDVFLCKNIFAIYAHYVAKKMRGKEILLQEFVPTSSGTDLRVMLAGDRIVFSVKRTAKTGFKANVSLGGTYEEYELSEKQQTQVDGLLGLTLFDIVGVDFLFGPDGELIFCEFNSAPAIFKFSDAISSALSELCRQKAQAK